MSDAGGGTGLAGATIHLDDQASSPLPDESPIVSGSTYQPRDFDDDGDDIDPPSTDGSTLSVFHDVDPNGEWDLYVLDDTTGDVGTLAGWTLRISTPDRVTTPTVGSALEGQTLADTGDVISGTGAAGNDIIVTRLPSIYHTRVDANGSWAITTSTIPDGPYTVVAKATDPFGGSLLSAERHVKFGPPTVTGLCLCSR